MEKEIEVNEFNKFLRNMKYAKSFLSYSTNTADIILTDENEKRLYSFAIDPSWRIVLKNKMIINSRNYPYHENYNDEEQEKEKNDFYEWCNKTLFMQCKKIVEINVLETGDLNIIWENGAILNKFVNDSEEADYYFFDKINNKVYDVMYGKIIQNDLKPYKKND
jgi:hypothetical protein